MWKIWIQPFSSSNCNSIVVRVEDDRVNGCDERKAEWKNKKKGWNEMKKRSKSTIISTNIGNYWMNWGKKLFESEKEVKN